MDKKKVEDKINYLNKLSEKHGKQIIPLAKHLKSLLEDEKIDVQTWHYLQVSFKVLSDGNVLISDIELIRQ